MEVYIKNSVGLPSFDHVYCARVSFTRADKPFSTHLSQKKIS